MDLEQKQLFLAQHFNDGIPVHIVTWSDSWINGYVLAFDGLEVTVLDRRDGEVKIPIKNISILSDFTGDITKLPRKEDQ